MEAKEIRLQDWQPEHLFWRHVKIGAPSECWNWTGFIDKNGYGRVVRRRRTFFVHRVSYVLAGNSIGPDQVTDHLCRNRACVNPAHLEATTSVINFQRGARAGMSLARRNGFCGNGHVLAVVGEHGKKSRRTCAECGRLRVRRYKARQRRDAVGSE